MLIGLEGREAFSWMVAVPLLGIPLPGQGDGWISPFESVSSYWKYCNVP